MNYVKEIKEVYGRLLGFYDFKFETLVIHENEVCPVFNGDFVNINDFAIIRRSDMGGRTHSTYLITPGEKYNWLPSNVVKKLHKEIYNNYFK